MVPAHVRLVKIDHATSPESLEAVEVELLPDLYSEEGCVRTRYEHRNGLVTELELVSYELSEPSEDYLPVALDNRWVYHWTDPASGTRSEDTVFVAANKGKEWELAFVTAAWARR